CYFAGCKRPLPSLPVNPPLDRLFLFISLLMLASTVGYAQKEVTYSVGVFSRLTSTFTFDEGINIDPRYQAKYGAHFVPGGIHAGVDYMGFGFMIDPQITQIGQSFNILNTQRGQVGERNVKITYLQLPFSYKKHIIDLSFFKVSFVAGISYAQLLSGSESITHTASKLRFPANVYSILPDTYEAEYDGVVSPQVKDFETLKKSDFKSSQVFGSLGIRSDWDITDNARLSFDFRANMGAFDPRSAAYLERAENNQTIYEISGERRDLFFSLTLGYSRYLFIEKKPKPKKVKHFVSYGPKRKKPK
ncbi:MAG: outer membrane beta-barrel protein, partial [Cyclobacteriaceae bacterium]|nr:outer membrane beta-barrel protein [Cyclobacteriaceae bacterium]